MIRKRAVKQILELLDTLQNGIDYIAETQSETAAQVLEACHWALGQISQIIQDEGIASTQFCLEKLNAVSDDLALGLGSGQCQIAKQRLRAVQKRLLKEPFRIEIAFFPYKQSMWDCMESVWRAADADPMCDCYVVPVPYYDRNPDGSLGTRHYEGALFPKDIPAVDYQSYDVTIRRPDIIYIHNPYDEYNRVTSVDPHYYSYKLKKHTDMLVYIPYYVTVGAKKMGVEPTLTYLSAYRHADYIAVQSQQVKDGMIDLGVPAERIMALGSPKMDSVINHQAGSYPSDWQKKIQGRTTFLVNTSLTDLLRHQQDWLINLQKMLTNLAKEEDCAIIWRPHPLIEATLKSMRIGMLHTYQEMKRELLALSNFVFDQSGSYLPAFDASHAFISDYSSLLLTYGVTGKPVLLLTGSKTEKEQTQYPFSDYYDYYFLQDGFTVDAFVDMVKRGQDFKREKRLAALRSSFVNLDGTAGEHIHKEVSATARSTLTHSDSR